MANGQYTDFRKRVLQGQIDVESDTIKALLLKQGVYTFSSAHTNLATDVPNGAGDRMATATLANVTAIADGIMDADDTVLTSVPAATAGAIIIYRASDGTIAFDLLMAYIDVAAQLPLVVPSTQNVTIRWSASSPQILRL